jgi:hypothetical protein
MTVDDFVRARREAMESLARSFIAGSAFPKEVYDLLRERGLGPETAVLVRYSPEPVCCADCFSGLLLTVRSRFFQFDIELGASGEAKIADVTASTDTDTRKRGIGTTDGYLALQLLETLKSEGLFADE